MMDREVDVHIDTSSLNRVVESTRKASELLEWLAAKNARLCVNEVVLVELFSHEDRERQELRREGLRCLAKKLGKARFSFSASAYDQLRYEFSQKALFEVYCNEVSNERALHWLNERRGFRVNHEYLRQFRRKKCAAIKMHENAFSAFKQLPRRGLPNLQSYEGPTRDTWLLQMDAERLSLALDDLLDTQRYPFYRRWLSFYEVTAISMLLHAQGVFPQNLGFVPGKRAWKGLFHDAEIGAAAAYADIFITEDTRFRKLFEFLRTKSIVNARAISLSLFLEDEPEK